MPSSDELTREVILPVPPEEAWDALTTESELEAWFADEVELDPRPGGEATFRWEGRGSRRAVVEEVSEPWRFAFRWDEEPDGATRSEGGPGTQVVFTLHEHPRGTRLVVVESGWRTAAPLGALQAHCAMAVAR
jgi:uncharacterized protein YndB with AHSA1/START domain